jgi:hypothetical protein
MSKNSYGIKVRVTGDEVSGYKVQDCINYVPFLPFLNKWYTQSAVYFSLTQAQQAAMARYNEWVQFYQKRELKKKQSKVVVWEYPCGK